MKYRWVQRPVKNAAAVTQLQAALNDLPEALAQSLVLRGITSFDEARHFFRASRQDLHNPFLMQDMDRAADRLADAIERKERVLVYGDYDVDGTTATTLLVDFLRERGVPASYFIPDRHTDGYGLGEAGINQAAEQEATLMVALDCGITATEEAAYARDKGIDLIICDHHKPPETLPDALAVLNPKRPDCAYPFAELSGCGVGFKLVQATLDRLGEPPTNAFAYLDLLAISTASDIVPVYGENRVLLREGLKALQSTTRIGIHALAKQAGLNLRTVRSTSNIVFTIGPRINAAGRLAHARTAVDLLLADDEADAERLARELETLNQQRRAIDAETREAAFKMAEQHITARTPHALVLYHPEWHLGVIGIVASRVVERYYKPTIMLCQNGTEVKGSARSIQGVNIYDALTDCQEVLTQFGGHDYAAGMSLPERNVEALREQFNAAIGERITPELLTPAIQVDAPLNLSEVGDIDGRFWAILKQFGPFGPTNERPIFHGRDLALVGTPRTVGRDGSHLKLRVRQADAPHHSGMDVIGFNMGEKLRIAERSQREGRPLELLFSVEENTFRGETTLQLKARDLRLPEAD